MNKQTDDELFRGSVMSFGEHLGELRICLWKAILGLAIGFGVGLCVGQYVVRFIQTPLTSALDKFYEAQNEEKLRRSSAARYRRSNWTTFASSTWCSTRCLSIRRR